MRHEDQPVSLEGPTDSPAKRKAAFEEIQGVLTDGPHAELVELGRPFRRSVEERYRRARDNVPFRSQTAGGVSVLPVES